MASPDLGVFGRIKTKQDFDREAEDFAMKKAIARAELKKAGQLDIDAMGEQAFYKAAQGLELTPQEKAAAQVVDAKSGGLMYNPVTGQATQKPRLSDKIGIDGLTPPLAPTMGGNPYAGMGNPAMGADDADIVPSLSMGELDGTDPVQPQNEFDLKYQEALNAAQGNPKLQQTIKADYMKSKISMNEGEAKAAGFADRMRASNNIMMDEDISSTALSPSVRFRKSIPLIGNYIVPTEYQQYDQAQRDFINAILRRESGAVIADSEFANADLQYFPQPGDSLDVLEQKRLNRENALSGVARSAGAAYTPTEIKIPKKQSLFDKSKAEFDSKKPKKRLVYNPSTGELE